MKSFLTGLATGLAIGYLTAPRSGKEMRDQIKNTTDEQSKNLKDQWDKTVSKVRKQVNELKDVTTSKPEPNLFADMESGKLDQYRDDVNTTSASSTTKTVNNDADNFDRADPFTSSRYGAAVPGVTGSGIAEI